MTARITSGQRDQITEFASARTRKVVDAFGLDIDQAQLVIGNGDEFGQIVGDAVRLALARLSVSQEYANEQVASTWVYPPEYTGPAPIGEQIDKLATLFGLSLGETMRFVLQVLPTLTLPDGAEGWFAIPSVNAIADRHFKSVTNPHERYCRAGKLMLEKLEESRSFCNDRAGQITADYLRQHARTAMMIERIATEQSGDILVIPAQFGLRHRGKSVRRSRATFRKDEFGLGAPAVGSMAFTHPKRFVRWNQLHTDCAGDEFVAAAESLRAPIFGFVGGELRFDTDPVDDADERYGSASGFLPQ
ncbi:MAG: hypothetical protein ABIA83_03005 [Patescibacteria group bacterium]